MKAMLKEFVTGLVAVVACLVVAAAWLLVCILVAKFFGDVWAVIFWCAPGTVLSCMWLGKKIRDS